MDPKHGDIKGLHCKLRIAYEQQDEVSNDVVCATSKGLDKPSHTHSLIRAFACHLNIL